MNKLMFAAGAAAMATTSFGYWTNDSLPAVYDYKASMKHIYLKEVSVAEKYWSSVVKANVQAQGGELKVYQKFQKSASLKGYLIMDNMGATSQTIIADNGDGNSNPGTTFDYGRNRGFLVVQNSNVENGVKFPKILPAVLDAKWFDTAFTKAHAQKSGIAEGTLFVGGDSVPVVRPQFDERLNTLNAGSNYTIVDRYSVAGTKDGYLPLVPSANTSPMDPQNGMTAYADYQWTSVYLFGKYSGPNMFNPVSGVAGPFDEFETAWDTNLPADLQIGFTYWQPFYHDAWFNGAGIGKWQKDSTTSNKKLCCGLMNAKRTTWNAPELVSLSGNVKGGLFLCTDNGIACWDTEYAFFDLWQGNRAAWEDQFVTGRLVGAYTDLYTFAGDKWQWDLWQDGAVEQETTDVLYGTWSIKLNEKFFNTNSVYDKNALTLLEITAIAPGKSLVEDATGLYTLVRTIKAAALSINKNAWVFGDTDIPAMFKADPESEKAVPMVTPSFAKYYGLANFKDIL